MASQNNTGRQFDKQHAVTLVAIAALAAHRFVAYDGGYPDATGGAKDVQGVTETEAAVGDAVSVVVDYSYLVECSAGTGSNGCFCRGGYCRIWRFYGYGAGRKTAHLPDIR